MSRRLRDILTADMFDVPQPASSAPGSLHCRAEIAGVMSEALRDCQADRFDVAAKMSRLLGREISKHMLDAYTAESRETHIPPLDVAIAFDKATEGFALANLYAQKLGSRLNVGEEVLLTELGRIDQLKADLAKQEKAIRKHLGRQS